MGKYRSHPEKVLARINRKHAIPLAYVGNNDYWIHLANGKSANPDFINETRRKIVEVYGGMGIIHSLEEGQQRVAAFREKGWDAMIVTDEEIYQKPDDVAARLLKFCGSGSQASRDDKTSGIGGGVQAPVLPGPKSGVCLEL